jgi:hypothetical protein
MVQGNNLNKKGSIIEGDYINQRGLDNWRRKNYDN